MQRLILIILSSFFLMISCNRSKPKGTLSEKTMIDLMTEVHLVDGYLNTLPVDSTRQVIDGLYGKVFENYGIDSVRFRENIAYYLGNPIASKELYVEITKKLNAYEDDYRRTDSLKNARISDSIRVVQRYQRLKETARRLILEVHADTIPLTYRVHQKDFMDGAGLYAIQTYQPTIQPTVSKEADEPHADVPRKSQVESNSVSVEQKPAATSRRVRPTPIRGPVPQKVEAKPLEN
ncbi:DUF4296 domain-containing protein [Sphingobacterium sp. SGR-19]|uniref:DUF4296 domain-containing protein n=1 Tax=Sphingobacterium sp. SGR-19 TaxID=2710886 RepID=UPI0013EC176F|nr:DUF4296 domain-containing protein [Sphingobacterium sp. SGR-19]NGM64009.1 DUF4296 domain-containing protein [Sphingobacterium sp. SGR-19]